MAEPNRIKFPPTFGLRDLVCFGLEALAFIRSVVDPNETLRASAAKV
jgi:hypothetical protein